MKPGFCNHEAALLEAIQSGRGADGCDADLRAHVAQCAICADVALVAGAIEREDARARAEVSIPAPGLVWWKAQIKSRREAVKRASEPIALVERAAGVFGFVAFVALAIWQWDWVRSWFYWMAQLPSADTFRPQGLWPADATSNLQGFSLLVVVSAVACLLLASAVLYFFFAED